MNINADFAKRASVHYQAADWVASPMPGVQRRMLDRIGGEVARATTIVRYAPGSTFSAHTHTGGEEFIVLDGVFQDEHGDYPEGTYVRNPPTSHHKPSSKLGAVIFVKLWQFDPQDRTQMTVNAASQVSHPVPNRPGVSEIRLFQDTRETVRIETWQPEAKIEIAGHKGLEVLVLDGSFEEGGEIFALHDWLRLPAGHTLKAVASRQGARVWIKSDHLEVAPLTPEV